MEKLHLLAEKNLRDAPSVENYAVLVKLILTRTLCLNRRTAAEIMSLSLKDFAARKRSDAVGDMDPSVSDLERIMCGSLIRIDVQGRCGVLPVFLKPSLISAMEVFIEVRKVCGIPSENPFLFARPTALTPYNAALCVKQTAAECGAEKPSFLTIRKLRRHYTTMMQLISLDEKEAEQILGSSNLVRTLREDSGAYLDDLHMRLEARLRFERRRASLHPGKHFKLAEFYEEHVAAAKSGAFKTKTVFRHLHVNKWDETEVQAIERHMMDFIKQQKVPQKNDCIKCLEAENEALRDRSWKGVKNYVRNRITTLQNAKKASKTAKKRCVNEDGNESDGISSDKNQSQHQDGSEGARNTHKHKWGEAEVRAVEKHLMRFIKEQIIPQKIDCVQCLDAEPGALRSRSWKGVKDYIRNRITALQSGRKRRDPAASIPSKTKKQRAAPNRRKGGVKEAVPQSNAQIVQQGRSLQQYNTQISSQGDARGQQAAPWIQSEHPGVPQGSTEVSTQQACQPSLKAKRSSKSPTVSSKKVFQSGGKNKWGEEEVQAVERQMMSFIEGHKIPQKNDCVRCLDTEAEALRNRSWKGLKDYVRNRITAHLRQGGTSQTTVSHSNWIRGEEPQPYQHYWTN